jgi:hypothetical protein
MGRPINKKFFGELNTNNVGGEGIATIATNGTGTLYTTSTTIVGTMTAPQVTGGVAATVSLTTNAVGNIATVTLLTAGTGYTSAPTALASPTTTGTAASFTVALTAAVQNGLSFSSFLLAKDGGANAVTGGDIIKQEASRRYLVRNSEGTGQVRLASTDAIVAGQMALVATDGSGATFFVTKLTANKATLVNRTSTSTAVVTGDTAQWTLGAATGTNQVTLASN